MSGCQFFVICSRILPIYVVQEVEKDVKARTKGELGAAKTLCTPFDQPRLPEGIVSSYSFLFPAECSVFDHRRLKIKPSR